MVTLEELFEWDEVARKKKKEENEKKREEKKQAKTGTVYVAEETSSQDHRLNRWLAQPL